MPNKADLTPRPATPPPADEKERVGHAMGKSVSAIHFEHSAIVRVRRLLPMLYKPSELAAALQISERTVRDNWLAKGLPCERDGGGRIMINGADVWPWMNSIRQANSKFGRKLAEDEAYCLRDRRAVKIQNPFVKSQTGQQVLIQGRCPICGGIVNRGRRKDG